MTPGERLERRLRRAETEGRTALLPYLVAGFPDRSGFAGLLQRIARHADVIEIGLPFSDPTADGPVIAAAGRAALAGGAHFGWVCELAAARARDLRAGLVLMSYFNPLLAVGLERAVQDLVGSGFEGLIVPDLPLEESTELRALSDRHGLALVQIVTPLTPPPRAGRIAAASRGFLYGATRTGTTGARADPASTAAYLRTLRGLTILPVCAGFGVRDAEQVRLLRGVCEGLIVGSALIELLARGEDPVPLLETLGRAAAAAGDQQ